MPIVIDATPGGAASNSYASLEEADGYLDAFYGEAWTGLADDAKARLLIVATATLDEMPLGVPKANPTQALNFPAADEPDSVAAARLACFHQAGFLLDHGDLLKLAEGDAILGTKQESNGSASRGGTGHNPLRRWSAKALRLLAPYTDFNMVIRRG
jgi:hypothetical protein